MCTQTWSEIVNTIPYSTQSEANTLLFTLTFNLEFTVHSKPVLSETSLAKNTILSTSVNTVLEHLTLHGLKI